MPDPEFGDRIGAESCLDLGSDVAAVRSRHRRPAAPEKKELPPPISWLVRADSHRSPMPWVMRKYYTSDGRLIIREERVRCHDYFVADRSDGRLVLNLVHVDDDDGVEESGGDAAEEEMRRPEIVNEAIDCDMSVEEAAAECYKYNGLGLKSCGGFVATVPVFTPPLHT
ncbi:hypothetical protein SASPL_113345 [Salvia splendens]|uniref:FAF domain-containing protein n=1 Tax=Salvia splendens TaxID=180675 RepID=A0A8X8Y2M4_SALSN|nr:uncharacterized protein LOC121803520 [Salvia splendens]KAG6422962.1 hypothetical protein SASPL_113345 [Salvia splendens]